MLKIDFKYTFKNNLTKEIVTKDLTLEDIEQGVVLDMINKGYCIESKREKVNTKDTEMYYGDLICKGDTIRHEEGMIPTENVKETSTYKIVKSYDEIRMF